MKIVVLLGAIDRVRFERVVERLEREGEEVAYQEVLERLAECEGLVLDEGEGEGEVVAVGRGEES